jgi:predicted nucleic acid-binding protein
MRACVAYQLSWFDAQIWSYAEHYGLEEILTEDLEHDRHYGTVRVVNTRWTAQDHHRKPQ